MSVIKIKPRLTPDHTKLDQGTLNDALSAEGSVVRALALVVLDQINELRKPLPAITPAKFNDALRAKMRGPQDKGELHEL